jgi:DNA N-6-adenine-methyltransferase (Dam)
MHGTSVATVTVNFYDDAERRLAEADGIDEVAQINNEAAGMEAYARRAKNKTLEIRARRIRFKATRRIGALIELQRVKFGLAKPPGKKIGLSKNPISSLPSLAQAGIDKNLAHLARKFFTFPEADFDALLVSDEERIWSRNAKIAVDLIGGKGGGELVQQSKSNEHYTPRKYLEAAREVLGGIDLDPASCADANEIVGAVRYYTVKDSGLDHSWGGRVWLNPPYGKRAGLFVAKFVEEFDAQHSTAGIILANAHCTDTDWFQPLWDGVLCFTDHRINFYGDDKRSGSTHGSVFAYFGPERKTFAAVFAQFGAIVRRFK